MIVFFHIRGSGYAGAVPLVQQDVELFEAWGFRGDVLRGLALLQGVAVQVWCEETGFFYSTFPFWKQMLDDQAPSRGQDRADSCLRLFRPEVLI